MKKIPIIKYVAKIEMQGNIYKISFPDIPECKAQSNSNDLNDALSKAHKELGKILVKNFDRAYSLPENKTDKADDSNYHMISAPLPISFSFFLRSLRGDKSQKEMAKEIGIAYGSYQRLENPSKCNPTLKMIDNIALNLNII